MTEPCPQHFKRIVFLTEDFLPHYGGSRIYCHKICEKLSTKYEVIVVTRRHAASAAFDQSVPYKLRRILSRNLPQSLWSELKEALQFLIAALNLHRQKRIDMLVLGETQIPGLAAVLMKKIFKIPYWVFVHGEELTITQRLRLEAWLQRKVLQQADRIVTGCDFARQRVSQLDVPEERLILINPGVEPAAFDPPGDLPSWRKEQQLNGEKIILTVGRLIPRKGHEAVLRVLPDLLREISHLKYVIVGKGPAEARLRRLVSEWGLEPHVLFVNEATNEDLHRWYWTCDVFVMPNRTLPNGDTEGFGMVFLEASARGKPVIGGAAGGTGDAIRHGITGLQVEGSQAEELRLALGDLLKDPEYAKKLGENGRLRAQKDFLWDIQLRKLETLLEQRIGK